MQELIKFVNELEKKNKEERIKLKAEAYGIGLETNYAISLRDSLNKNAGEFWLIEKIKSKLYELQEKEKLIDGTDINVGRKEK